MDYFYSLPIFFSSFILLCTFNIMYLLTNQSFSKTNLKRSIFWGFVCFSFSAAIVVCYIIFYGFTFGEIENLIKPILQKLPWVLKNGYVLIFPVLFGIYVFGFVLSVLTLKDSLRNPRIKERQFILTISAMILFILSIFILIKVCSEWIMDQRFLNSGKNYLNIASHSADPQELRSLFQTVSASRDADINDPQWLIPNIAENEHSPVSLLVEIDQYAASLKNEYTKNSILQSLAKNPHTPTHLLEQFTENPPAIPTQTYPIVAPSLISLAENPNTPKEGLEKIFTSIANLPIEDKAVQSVLRALIKNPNTSQDVLRKIYTKLSVKPEITYDLIAFADNPNTPNDIFQNLVDKMKERVNTTSIESTYLETSFINGAIQALINNPSFPVNIIQQLSLFHDCDLRKSVYQRLISARRLELLQFMQAQEQDIGNQRFLRLLLKQPITNNDSNNSQITSFNAQVKNSQTPEHTIKEIVDTAIAEIKNQNLIWLDTLLLVASNPQLSDDEFQILKNFPSCEVRKNLVRNPSISSNDISTMSQDEDQSVRFAVRERLQK